MVWLMRLYRRKEKQELSRVVSGNHLERHLDLVLSRAEPLSYVQAVCTSDEILDTVPTLICLKQPLPIIALLENLSKF